MRQDQSLSPASGRMATNLVRDRGQIKHRVLIVLIGGVRILATKSSRPDAHVLSEAKHRKQLEVRLHFPSTNRSPYGAIARTISLP